MTPPEPEVPEPPPPVRERSDALAGARLVAPPFAPPPLPLPLPLDLVVAEVVADDRLVVAAVALVDREPLAAPVERDAPDERFDPAVERFFWLRVGVEDATCTCPFSKRTKGNRWAHDWNYIVVGRARSVTPGLRLAWMG